MLWSWIGRHYLVGDWPGARQAGSGWYLRTRPISPSRASRWSACCDLNATPESARSFASTDTCSCLAQRPARLAALRPSLDVQRADGLRGVRCSSAQRRKEATSMVLYSHRAPRCRRVCRYGSNQIAPARRDDRQPAGARVPVRDAAVPAAETRISPHSARCSPAATQAGPRPRLPIANARMRCSGRGEIDFGICGVRRSRGRRMSRP